MRGACSAEGLTLIAALTAPAPRYLKLAEVKARFSVGTSTIYRWMDRGDFPRPVRLGAGSVRWIESELDAWAQSRPTAA